MFLCYVVIMSQKKKQQLLMSKDSEEDMTEKPIKRPKMVAPTEKCFTPRKERLILAVREQPALYQKNLKDYSNREKKESAWAAVAESCDCTREHFLFLVTASQPYLVSVWILCLHCIFRSNSWLICSSGRCGEALDELPKEIQQSPKVA